MVSKNFHTGHLTYTGESKKHIGGTKPHTRYYWQAFCDCGTEVWNPSYSIKKSKQCINCYLSRGLNQPGVFRQWFLAKIKNGCKRDSKTIEFNISVEDLNNQWKIQDGKCFYTGIQLTTAKTYTEWALNPEHFNCSVDRINSDLNYTADNIVLCCKAINIMKGMLSVDEFTNLCSAVYLHSKPSKLDMFAL